MKYDPDKHHRRSIRLRGYDYKQAGAYFITLCTQNRHCLFGQVMDGEMVLNEYGERVSATWHGLPDHYRGIALDAFVVMPNHVHGIVVLGTDDGTVGAGLKPAPTINPVPTNKTGAARAGLKPAPTNNPVPTITPVPTNEPALARAGLTVGAGLKPAPTRITTTPARIVLHGLGEIVRAFKTFSARHINETRGTPGVPVWQRNYYEHVIRDEPSLLRIREYILNNPLRWELDRENPARAHEGVPARGNPPQSEDTSQPEAEPWHR